MPPKPKLKKISPKAQVRRVLKHGIYAKTPHGVALMAKLPRKLVNTVLEKMYADGEVTRTTLQFSDHTSTWNYKLTKETGR